MGMSDVQYCGKMWVLEKLFEIWFLKVDKVFFFSCFVK